MFVICWSAKGGCGTTVVASSLAVLSARRAPTVLVDLGGDAPACLGIADRDGDGVRQWLDRGGQQRGAGARSAPMADGEQLWQTALEGGDDLRIVTSGAPAPVHPDRDGWERLIDTCAAASVEGTTIVLDAGDTIPPPIAHLSAGASLAVVRPCYLALRRAARATLLATGVVLVSEPLRALTRQDVARTFDAPIVAEIAWDPAVARAVDAGLLATRLPGALRGPLDRLVDDWSGAVR